MELSKLKVIDKSLLCLELHHDFFLEQLQKELYSLINEELYNQASWY
jgi:hypothetical protein